MRVMLRGDVLRSGSFARVAVVAGLLTLSCGGDAATSSVVGSSAAQSVAVANEDSVMTASRQPAVASVCHYDKTLDSYSTLNLTGQSAAAHLANHSGDYAGACTICPCFTAADFANASCDENQDLGWTCVGGFWTSGWDYVLEGNLAQSFCFAGGVRVSQAECGKRIYDPEVGLDEEIKTNLSAAEAAACKAVIVTSPYYPPSCPQ